MKKHSRDKETERERSKSSGAIELNAARQAGSQARPGQLAAASIAPNGALGRWQLLDEKLALVWRDVCRLVSFAFSPSLSSPANVSKLRKRFLKLTALHKFCYEICARWFNMPSRLEVTVQVGAAVGNWQLVTSSGNVAPSPHRFGV